MWYVVNDEGFDLCRPPDSWARVLIGASLESHLSDRML
jgi:hypothetical protein